jgi:hypothetical protein
MPVPRFEVPSGVIDGVNTVFNVSVPYRPGTTAVFLNGLLLEPTLLDGWTETNPATGEITLKEPPRVTKVCPDVVQVFFIDTSPVLPETVVVRLHGRLRAVDELEGRLIAKNLLQGSVEALGSLEARLTTMTPLRGELEDQGELHGRVRAVCGG